MASTDAHSWMFKPRVLYHQAPSKYVQVVIPELPDDSALGLPPADEESELWSVGASTSERFIPGDHPAHESRLASGAHAPNQGVGSDESGYTTGATGVWAIVGPT